jgi:hypothetical protein
MAKILLKHYLWLIDKLSKRPMTFIEISDSFERSSLYDDNHPLQVRTLYNWREKIDELFGIQIKYDNDTYKLQNYDDLRDSSPQSWLIHSIAVNDVVQRSHKLKSRILLENIPSGEIFLTQIIESMEESKTLKLTYRRFCDNSDNTPIEVEPYCIKVNNRRWYVLCHVPNTDIPETECAEYRQFGCLKIYALDRIQELVTTDKTFVFPEKFEPEDFFSRHFGVCVGYDVPMEKVLIRIDGDQRSYLRTLPLHGSQREIKTYDDYSIFEYHLHPTIDFIHAILSFGAEAEVIEPLQLRSVIADEAAIMNDFYHSSSKKKG